MSHEPHINRRSFLKQATCLGIGAAIPDKLVSANSPQPRTFQLRPSSGRARLVPEPYSDTAVLHYNDSLPGPEIRVVQGEQVSIELLNQMEDATTVHWHGQRVPNHMDGVPHLTQPPVQSNTAFRYNFVARDAGTYWYHPHFNSLEQVGRGLYGAFIVEEQDPVNVDRELTWILDDWRLEKSAEISDDFGHMHDKSHAGRIGNTVTINGVIPDDLFVESGERIRIRLINAANARLFSLNFQRHEPMVIAIDGHAVTPHQPKDGAITLAPGMRMDIILDCIGQPGERFAVSDTRYRNRDYELINLAYDWQVKRETLLDSPIQLASPDIPEPDMQNPLRTRFTLGGGARGRLTGAQMNGEWHDIRSMVRAGMAWAINGVVATGHTMDPFVEIERNRTCVFEIDNDTAWAHPMHLHGHSFRVISRNGQPTLYREWQDTVLIEAGDSTEIAFVADNPGNWMFHCHILEHQIAGMMGVVRVNT